ncbi:MULTISPECIES: YjfB family protein [Gulbenkiania]|uniref:Motility protein YjfB-like n=2 Tax=Gulbenkiania TaxID=397456 RepID=A0ABY2CW94_GULMO|nr:MULTISPECIES: YjfB family protein [Gulbenkiania]TCW31504.1 putative motility protein YjfB-like [Gulbenkiania mobilis]CUA84375.1 Putative motility protein [Gulbenkiania indica]
MDGIASLSTAMAQAKVAQSVQIFALKRASEVAAQGTLALIQGIAAPEARNNPAHLGQNIDITA